MVLDRIRDAWHRGSQFLDCERPILGGAMSWLSESHLVAAISEAGGFGVLASGSMPPELFRQEIRETRRKTGHSFGVNLITLNPQLPELIQVTVEEKVTHCVLAGGLPDRASVRRLREGGVKVIVFAPALSLAKRMIQLGADALVIEGHEAGGHVGPVATSVLVQEVLPHITEIPVFVAGGISSGDMVMSMMAMGASGCQVGTLFVCTHECVAHERFKQAFIKAQARDAQVTVQFDPALPVIPVRALVNKGTAKFNELQWQAIQEVKSGSKTKHEAILDLERFWVGALRRAAMEGDVEFGSVMAGQSVGMVTSQESVATVMTALSEGCESILG